MIMTLGELRDVGVSESWEAVRETDRRKYLITGQQGHMSLNSSWS